MKLTLCDKNLVGDIPEFHFDSFTPLDGKIMDWFKTKDFNKSVFVFFNSWTETDNFRYEHPSFLVSCSPDDIIDFIQQIDEYQESMSHYPVNINIFEFDSFEEAFKYCIDLKEGF